MKTKAYIAALLTALTLISCGKENFPADANGVVITLSPGIMTVTRETEYGSDKYNENVISDFKLYFYTSDSESEAATYVYPSDGSSATVNADDNTGAVTGGTNGLTVDPTTGKVSLSLALEKKVGDALFPSGASNCYVYAVVNTASVISSLPYETGTSATSIAELKQLSVKAEFGPTTSAEPWAEAQKNFVMDGKATLTKSGDNITGDVPLTRAAAKITFTVSSVKNVEDKDEFGNVTGTWTARTDATPSSVGMRVCYRNGVNAGFINGEMSETERDKNIFGYETKKSRTLTGDAASGWTHEMPFYSYFDSWASSASADAPYLLVSIPWAYTPAGATSPTRYFTCYYSVPFNPLDRRIDRNTWYKVSLSVSILGSGDPDNPVEIKPSYMILPWGSETVKTDAELIRYRYLMVDRNEYTMDNVNSLTIPYYSSHNIKITSSSMTKTILKPTSGYKPYEDSVDASKYTLSFNSQNQTITFTHNLVNDYSDNENNPYDVTAYTLTFTIQHDSGDSEDSQFTETITITQYPALYVVADLNSDCVDPTKKNGLNASGNKNNHGYVWINGSKSTNSSSSWNRVSGSPGNSDPYMYVISVSSLPANSTYVVGDPRTEESTDLGTYNTTNWLGQISYWAAEAAGMDGNNRRLAYYYPSDESSRVDNMIAPSFRIASSYGAVATISYSDAKKRCASYQEDGYPAGRWRVPTKAEIEYMAMLADDGKIPILLSIDSYYWASNKTAYSPEGKNHDSYSNVRCVYDEWYWKDTCTKTTFTWGDKQR